MKVVAHIPDLGQLAASVLGEHLVAEIMKASTVNRTAAEALVAARIVLELPSLEGKDEKRGEGETLGRLVAGLLLKGRLLTIEVDDTTVRLLLDDEIVSENLLRYLLDFDEMLAAHADWHDLCGGSEAADYQLVDGSRILLFGTAEHWARYAKADTAADSSAVEA